MVKNISQLTINFFGISLIVSLTMSNSVLSQTWEEPPRIKKNAVKRDMSPVDVQQNVEKIIDVPQNMTTTGDSKYNTDKIKINIEQSEIFEALKKPNPYVSPGEGNHFVGFLVSVENLGEKKIYGGSSDHHRTFNIMTSGNYVVEAENTSSDSWKNDRLIWTGSEIEPHEKRKGWIVFRVPKQEIPVKFIFIVDEETRPGFLKSLGSIKVPLK